MVVCGLGRRTGALTEPPDFRARRSAGVPRCADPHVGCGVPRVAHRARPKFTCERDRCRRAFPIPAQPAYLGTFLLSIGLGLLTSRLGFVILVGGAILRILRLIGREEAILQAEKGESFREYRRRVPGLLPALTPRA